MQRAALASAVVIDLGARAAVDDLERCGRTGSCAERFVTPRAGGVLSLTLLLPPGVLRARLRPPCA